MFHEAEFREQRLSGEAERKQNKQKSGGATVSRRDLKAMKPEKQDA